MKTKQTLFRRILCHLFSSPLRLRMFFTPSVLKTIENKTAESELQHAGQVRFVVEHALDLSQLIQGLSSRQRALQLFSSLRIWDTEHNSGVLIYLLFAERKVEIIADRGIHACVGDQQWQSICREMETHFRKEEFEAGVLLGMDKITQLLAQHFPYEAGTNEIPDRPIVF